jgi:probable HAF family extracellular repeat protein
MIAVLFAALCGPACAQTVPAYAFVDLGTLTGQSAIATSINNAGQVAGWALDSSGNQRAFRITPLDTDNDSIPDTWCIADSFGHNALMQVYSLPQGYVASIPYSINSVGAVGGQMFGTGGALVQTVFYGAANGAGATVGTKQSVGLAINDRKSIYGLIIPKSGDLKATVWRMVTGSYVTTDLGFTAIFDSAYAGGSINNLDQITGMETPINRAFIWLPSPAYNLPSGKTSLRSQATPLRRPSRVW